MKACSDRRKGNGLKLRESRFRYKRIFLMMRHWNTLPREVVGAPSLEAFKARLNKKKCKKEIKK